MNLTKEAFIRSRWALNQRVEPITTDTLAVGIDIAKDFHVAQAAPVGASSVPPGFAGVHFSRRLCAAARGGAAMADNLSDVIVGMEWTAH